MLISEDKTILISKPDQKGSRTSLNLILWWGRESWQNIFKSSVEEYESNFICPLPTAVHLINQVPFLTADAGDGAEGSVRTKSAHKQVPTGVSKSPSLTR